MGNVNEDALKAIVDEVGIYTTLTMLVNIMIQKGKSETTKERRKIALSIAENIKRARDVV